MILCLCWIQFWQPRRELWDQRPTGFGWMSENGSSFLLPIKILLPLGRVDYCFDDPCSEHLTKGRFFSAHCPGMNEKAKKFFPQFLSSKCSYGEVDCIFDNPDKNVLREGREIFTRCQKLIRNSNFFETSIFYPTCSSAHVKCNFDKPWKSLGNRPKKIDQLLKMIEEVQCFWKVFPKIVIMDSWNESTLANPMEVPKQKAEKLTLIVQKWRRKYNLMRSFFPQKCYYSHVKGNFVNPVGLGSLEGQFLGSTSNKD